MILDSMVQSRLGKEVFMHVVRKVRQSAFILTEIKNVV